MSATKNTMDARVRTSAGPELERLVAQHGRTQTDILTAAVTVAAAHPELLRAALALLPDGRPPPGTGRRFKKVGGAP